MSHFLSRAVLVALVASSITVHAFYLPGAAPHDYREGEKVDLFVNALTPMLSGADDAKLVCTYSTLRADRRLMISEFHSGP
jgi:transmembrane 9 superfamily member 2/4